MNIAVTKTFAKFINKTAKALNFEAHAVVVSMSSTMYHHQVSDNIFDAYDYGDYDCNTGNYKAIMVTYPENYYACPRFLTTKELNDEFRWRSVTTSEELQEMLRDMLEV